MPLAYNEEQRSLKDTAKDFAANRAPIEAFRQLRDNKDEQGYSSELWQEMVELGWSGALFPEAYGGFDFGLMGVAGSMEELGRTLVASPLLSSVVLAGSAIYFGGTEEQKTELLPQIIGGEKVATLALEEKPHHNPAQVALAATADGDNYVLNGNKTLVLEGNSADLLVVAARTSGTAGDTNGITLFLVDANANGVSSKRTWVADSRAYARISFDNVSVPASAVLGSVDQGFDALDKALDRARICLASEMFGGMLEIFDRTVEYLKERKQFGQVIGTFQALQHRCAHMYTEIQVCKSALMNALNAAETGADNAPQLISAAKAKMSETYELISNQATQLHGGIGVTDELDIGLFLKRARLSAVLFGDANFHYDRYATLEGF